MKNKQTYTLQEIVRAWEVFTRPRYYWMDDSITSIKKLEPEYCQWITFLVSEEWREDEK